MGLQRSIWICTSLLLFICVIAQEEKDNEIDPMKAVVERRSYVPADVDSMVMDGAENSNMTYCNLNETCAFFYFDRFGYYVKFKGICDRCIRSRCIFTRLDRPRCRIQFRCVVPDPNVTDPASLIPTRAQLLQDGKGQRIDELRYCPRYLYPGSNTTYPVHNEARFVLGECHNGTEPPLTQLQIEE